MNKDLKGYFLASDIDGTLVYDSKICPENITAISDFIARGGLFTIATGRSIRSALPIAQAVNANCPIVINNGCAIYDTQKNEFIWKANLTKGAKKYTLDVLKEFPSLGAMVFFDDGMSVLRSNEVVEELVKYENLINSQISIDEILERDWAKVLFGGTPDILDMLTDFCTKNGKNAGDYVRSGNFYYELLPFGVSKGAGFMRLVSILGVEHNKVCAIGDFYNDRQMVQQAGIGSYVAGAPDELKNECAYVAKDCADGGVADFINYITNLV